MSLTGQKVLIANRGEIAIRVIRSCRKLGLPTVAVFSEADRNSLHVAMADEAVCIGPPPAAQSYLMADKIIAAVKQTKATAVHPGFGFLSENAGFAEKCGLEKIKFIGPSPKAIQVMGDKISARRQMKAAGVPIVPGTVDPLKDMSHAKTLAKEVGYPVMLKATAGGGGKGMRKVDQESQMDSMYEAASSEAQKFFANGDLYLEKFIPTPHHIEVQVFGYGKDHAVHLFERECSIQRRHQKVIEEAPSPLITPEIREKLTQVAIQGSKAIGYEGAGTMEFVADSKGNFYFMEMNTRLQVEHTVSEWITGADLVEEQLRYAFNENCLLKDQKSLAIRGHSVQCRIYAEDPIRFFPSPGVIQCVRWPQGPFVRVDTHIEPGAEISMFYDPMIAKLSTWGRTRAEAIKNMEIALSELVILGIETNISFHQAVMRNKVFQSGQTTTAFIEEQFPEKTRTQLVEPPKDKELEWAADLTFASLQEGATSLTQTGIRISPWVVHGLRSQLRN